MNNRRPLGAKVTARMMMMIASITRITVIRMHFFFRALDYKKTTKIAYNTT